jgi:hypothetical protein
MNRKSTFERCLQSRAKSSLQLGRLLQDGQLLAELADVAHECSLREHNQRCFILRGKLDVRDVDLDSAIWGAVQHVVDDDAANSISQVLRLATNLILVKCNSKHQCSRITSQRRAFSSIDRTACSSAAAQRVLRTQLYVDNYCTKEQLGIRDSLWQVFRELKATRLRPYFEGELLHYYPAGSKRAIVHKAESSTEQQQHAAMEQPLVVQPVVQEVQQQEQPRAEQAVARQAVEQQSVEQLVLQRAQPEQQSTTTPPPPAAAATGGGVAAGAPPATDEPAALPSDAAAASAVTAPAPNEAASHQVPRQKKTRPAMPSENQASTQRNTRPPFRSITNTAPRFSTGPTTYPGKRFVQRQPDFGPGARKHDMRRADGCIPTMLPSGQITWVLQ